MAAPTISNKYNNWADPGGATLTISSVVIALGEQLIVVAMGSDGTANATTGEVTGVTWNSIALTKKVEDLNCLGDDGTVVSIWQLPSGQSGTASVVITYNGTPAHGLIGEAYAIAGGSDTLDNTAHNGALSPSSPQTNSITTNVDNCLVIDVFVGATSAGNITIGGTPQIGPDYDPYGTTAYGKSPTQGSHYVKTPAGSASFSWTPFTTARGYTWAAVSIAPAAPAAGPQTLNNYQFVKTGNGMSASVKG